MNSFATNLTFDLYPFLQFIISYLHNLEKLIYYNIIIICVFKNIFQFYKDIIPRRFCLALQFALKLSSIFFFL